MGLFKKMAIADRMATYADPVFANPSSYGTYATWIATIAYAIQIFCDFSGYTDMALGSAHLLGFKLAPNFRMPYLATNVAEFWRRWHMSLSTWLRDYLFIPLGGSRGTHWQTSRNLLITMTLGGLWHGASWTFVAWGLMHGIVLIIHRAFSNLCQSRNALTASLKSLPGTVLRIALTFVTVATGWVFFRSTTFASAGSILRSLYLGREGLPPPLPTDLFWVLIVIVVIAHFVGSIKGWSKLSKTMPSPIVGFSYALAFTVALLLTPATGNVFIYFQF
jgi:alginate O-acetyltransferase complex protein AlgI